MADTKITALTALTAADPANDVLPIVDVSDTTMAASGTTKKISVNNILGASGTATLASATITGDLTVDTNVLKVDSANNFVGVGTTTGVNLAAGRGNLTIGGSSSAILNLSIGATDTGYVIHDGTSIYLVNRIAAGSLIFSTNSSTRYQIASDGVATWSNVGGVAGTAMTLNSTGLGIGVGPSYPFHLRNSAAAIGMIHSTNANGPYVIFQNSTANFGDIGSELSITGGGSAGNMTINSRFSSNLCFSVSDTVRMRIDSSGNVGIGVTPIERLTVAGTASVGGTGNIGVKFHSGSPVTGNLAWLLSNDSANSNILNLYYYNAGVFSGRAFVVNQSGNFMVRTPSTPPTIPDNEMMVFNLTSNTNLRISVKGTDGTVRTANITLA